MREHVKHQWNYSMNMTKGNSDEAQVSSKNLSEKIKKILGVNAPTCDFQGSMAEKCQKLLTLL